MTPANTKPQGKSTAGRASDLAAPVDGVPTRRKVSGENYRKAIAQCEALRVERDSARAQVAELAAALEVATACVELYTGNGVRKQPKSALWPASNETPVDHEAIATACRAALAKCKVTP